MPAKPFGSGRTRGLGPAGPVSRRGGPDGARHGPSREHRGVDWTRIEAEDRLPGPVRRGALGHDVQPLGGGPGGGAPIAPGGGDVLAPPGSDHGAGGEAPPGPWFRPRRK